MYYNVKGRSQEMCLNDKDIHIVSLLIDVALSWIICISDISLTHDLRVAIDVYKCRIGEAVCTTISK